MQRFVRAAWPVVVWMGFVFLMSTDVGSANHTSRILGPLLHWLDPHISPEAVERVHFLVRKGAHVTEYAILGLLLVRAVRIVIGAPSWSWRVALVAFAAAAVYAGSDEIHQLFVSSRGPSLHDVMIDACGAALGISLAYVWTRARRETPAVGRA